MPIYECPTCHAILNCATPAEAPYRPFCSRRCKLVDLGKWLNEEYRVTEEIPEELRDEPSDRDTPGDAHDDTR